MPLNPSRRDTIGPPRRSPGDVGKDLTDLSALVRHHGSYLRSLNPGMLGGRWQTPKPIPLSGPSQLVGDDGGAAADTIKFENTDTAVCGGPNQDININLTHIPEEGSEQVFYNGTPLKRRDWSRTDSVLNIPGEVWFRAGKSAWVDYAYYEEQIADPPQFISVVTVQRDQTSIALPSDQQIGDLLVLVLSANNQVGCSDSRFTAKSTGTYPSVPGPTMGIWVGTDDGSGAAVSVHMDSISGSGGADSCGAIMRIRGFPLLPATAEVATSGSGSSYSPAAPAGGTYGVMAIASAVGLVASTISDDSLGNWTTRARTPGAGSGKSSLWIGTLDGPPAAGQWNQAGSSPQYVSWAGGLQ